MIQLDASFAFAIPERLTSANAAPLLCAGLTTYSALRQHTTPAAAVGVLGIGGLGQLALQFAAKRGNEVTALSGSPSKEQEARRLGAQRFLVTRDAGQMKAATGSLDFILSTVDAELNWAEYLNLLRPDGKLCFVGASAFPLNVPSLLLVMGQRSLVGSSAGSRSAMNEMLTFAGRHGVQAEVEVVPLSAINTALDRMRKSEAQRRIVLER